MSNHDPVNNPQHYTSHPSGVECITITEHFNFNIGNAIKYLWRAGLKGIKLEDLRKAQWYVNREIQRIEAGMEKARIDACNPPPEARDWRVDAFRAYNLPDPSRPDPKSTR